MSNVIAYYLFGINFITFIGYGIDKFKAKKVNGVFLKPPCSYLL